MSILNQPYFQNEEAAYAKLESLVWPNGPVCPKCGVIGGAYRLAKRPGLYRCKAKECGKDFTATVGTVYESSHVKLHLWLQASYLMCSSKKGISAHQLHRTLGVTYKTAWFMAHRIREAMREANPTKMGGPDKIAEADETYIGGREKNKHRSKRTSAVGGSGKEPVFSLVERKGRVRSHHVTEVTGKTLGPILRAQLNRGSALMTDEAGQYLHVGKEFARHETVRHGIEEYVRGEVHTNTIEGYFSLLKRGINGTYHHVSQQHLKRYLGEFDFRYNERIAMGVDDQMRADKAIKGIVGKRLMYRDSSVV